MMVDKFSGKVALQQRVLPSYRGAFLDTLANACVGGLSVFAGKPLPQEGIEPLDALHVAQYVQASNRYIANPSSPLFFCWQAGVIRWLESWQPDVLVVEANPRYLTTPSAIRWMHARGRKVLGWGLGAPRLTGPFSGIRNVQRLRFLHSLDAVIAYSRQGADQYLQLGLPPGRVHVAFNAVDPPPTTLPPARPPQFGGKPVILFVGRLQARKRLDLLLQACAGLPGELQPHLVIIGDGPARASFEALARNIYPRAEFIGARYGAELDHFYNQADLFVLPGTGGLAIQQAMAHALPVIVARGDGTQDDLVRDENGWQVTPDDLPALAEVLRAALSDAARLRAMGQESFRIVREEINIETMAQVFVRVFNSLK